MEVTADGDVVMMDAEARGENADRGKKRETAQRRLGSRESPGR